MPPTRPIAPPPPTVPTPQTQTLAMLNPDSLSSAEELLLSVAICIDSTIQEFQRRGGRVNVPFFQKSLDEELLEASTIFTGSPAGKADPRLHSIITYVGELSEQAEDRHTPLNLGAIRLSEVARRCGMATTACPMWPQELFISDLTPLLRLLEDDTGAYTHFCNMWPTVLTLKHSRRWLRHLMLLRTPPNLPPSSLPLQSHPPQMKMFRCRQRMGVTPHAIRRGLGSIQWPHDPAWMNRRRNACASMMRENRRECKDLPGKATACASCAAHKVKCDRPKHSGNVSPALKGKSRWHTALKAVEDQRETLETLQNDNTKLQEVLYTMEQMLRDLCIKANISPPPPVQHRIPQAPPLYESPAANPSSASIESAALSTSSSFHLNMLTINSPTMSTRAQPVAGPSKLGPEQMQRAASGTGQCSQSWQRGGGAAKAPTRAASAAASRWSSRTRG
ncbi:hypothetical protein EI94DRAFT_1708704 [Lactarius quietus]|nr:hypothetical protein EI94DRAFT_1708704 [Lactarius quietus]